MKAAYYSRNNSYSKSFNAEQAERDGRFPLTRAAAYMGLSVAAFKAGIKKAGYTASEWHHVGKYATSVDYYDTNELEEMPLFWKGATTRSNKGLCKHHITRIFRALMPDKYAAVPVRNVTIEKEKYMSKPTYSVSMSCDRHLGKAIGDIRRTRRLDTRTPLEGLVTFVLYTDGRIMDNDRNRVLSESIDWSLYEAHGLTKSNGIRFYKSSY